MSSIGSAIFYDGFTNTRHAVAVTLGADRVEISAPAGELLAVWRFSEIGPLPSPEGVLRLGWSKSRNAARLEIRDAGLAGELTAVAKWSDRSGLTDRRTRTKVASWGIATVLSLVASTVWGVPFAAERLAPRLPVSAEIRLGDAVDAQIRRMLDQGNGDKPFQCGGDAGHAAGRAAFNKLIGALEASADLPVPLRAEVVRSPVVNAIALPGGRVYLFEGLLNQAQSPDEIAGVLAHELGHVAHRDGTKNVLEAGGTSLLFGAVLGDFTGGSAAVAVAQVVLRSASSRDKEAAADDFGARLVSRNGGDPNGLAKLLERISVAGTQAPHFLLDHPEAQERSAAIGRVASPEVRKPLLTSQEWAALKRICT
jgi:Zn-dependent protease with chaperone function